MVFRISAQKTRETAVYQGQANRPQIPASHYKQNLIWLYRIVVSTLASHADNRGSNPLRVTKNRLAFEPHRKEERNRRVPLFLYFPMLRLP